MEFYMRKRCQYSAEFKENLLTKALAPNAPSVVELANRAGIPSETFVCAICYLQVNQFWVGCITINTLNRALTLPTTTTA